MTSPLSLHGLGMADPEASIRLGLAMSNEEQDHAQIMQAIEGAASVAQKLEDGPVTQLTLHSGVVIRLTPVPPLALREAAISVSAPVVPMVNIPDDGRLEPNPNDPDYLKALERYNEDQIFRVANVVMLLGTELEACPENIERPEDDGWIEKLEALGINVPKDNKYTRYLSWLRLYALRANDEVTQIISSVVALSGVTEVEVQRAASAFRGAPQR